MLNRHYHRRSRTGRVSHLQAIAMNPKSFGIDLHSIAGFAAITGAAIIGDYNLIMGAIAGTATAFYMALRAYREFSKVKSNKSGMTSENKKHEIE